MRKRMLVAIIVLATIIFVAGAAYAAYTILNVTGEVTVTEAITVTPETFTVGMYPAETVTETLTLNNAASVGIEVNFIASVMPPDPEITVIVPAKVTVPATGSTTADIDVTASKSAIPGSYSITIGITR